MITKQNRNTINTLKKGKQPFKTKEKEQSVNKDNFCGMQICTKLNRYQCILAGKKKKSLDTAFGNFTEQLHWTSTSNTRRLKAKVGVTHVFFFSNTVIAHGYCRKKVSNKTQQHLQDKTEVTAGLVRTTYS